MNSVSGWICGGGDGSPLLMQPMFELVLPACLHVVTDGISQPTPLCMMPTSTGDTTAQLPTSWCNQDSTLQWSALSGAQLSMNDTFFELQLPFQSDAIGHGNDFVFGNNVDWRKWDATSRTWNNASVAFLPCQVSECLPPQSVHVETRQLQEAEVPAGAIIGFVVFGVLFILFCAYGHIHGASGGGARGSVGHGGCTVGGGGGGFAFGGLDGGACGGGACGGGACGGGHGGGCGGP